MRTRNLGLLQTTTLLALLISGAFGAKATNILWTNKSGGDWSVSSYWNPNQIPGSNDSVTISSQSISVSIPITVSNLVLSGATLAGPEPVTVLDNFTWTGGTLSGTVFADGSLLLGGVGIKTLSSGVLVNEGQGSWTNGSFYIGGGGMLSNSASATFSIAFNGAGRNIPSGNATIANAGLFIKSGGTGAASLDFALNNTGTVQAQSGVLDFSSGGVNSGVFSALAGATVELSGGAHNLSDGTTVSGAGAFQIGGTAVVNLTGNYAVTNGLMTLSGGNLNLNASGLVAVTNLEVDSGTLAGSEPVTVLDNFTWTGGTLSGTVSANGSLLLGGVGIKTLSGGVLVNERQGSWTNGSFYIGGGGMLSNSASGVFSIAFNGVGRNIPSGNAMIANAGLFIKSGGTGVASLPFALDNTGTVQAQSGVLDFSSGSVNSGVFSALAGATVELSGGAHNLSDGTTVSGAGAFQIDGTAVVNLTGSYTVTNGLMTLSGGNLNLNASGLVAVTNLEVDSGTLAGSEPVTVLDNFTWTGGTLSGTVFANGSLLLGGTGIKTLSSGVLVNQGQGSWTNGSFYIGGGGMLSNSASGAFSITFNGVGRNIPSGNATIANAGLFIKSGGTGAASLPFTFANSGNVEVQTGILDFSETYTQNNGQTVLNGGNIENVSTLMILGGSLVGNGSINGSVLVGSGASFAPGTSAGPLTINQSLTLNPGSATFVTMDAGTATNAVLQELSTLNYGGTLTVTNLSGTPSQDQTFQIINTYSHTGNFNFLTQKPGPGLRWRFDPTLGVLSLVSSYSQPSSVISDSSKTNVILNATSGPPGSTAYLIGSTNVALPLANWTRVATNVFDVSGDCVFTSAIQPKTPGQFYSIVFLGQP